ncbi:hypothetical protein A8924_3252 [Saccharopolyspora erythraea NRRL 2338]|uniref:Uncharacterized protein n=2 Tax=Saccharopolyspora erythraea TaxID=1836 RepID=A4FDL3_SACEN|nr:hypothetical protein [Saccharopolyspora erythraea]EQD81852.1 hypothetical protein N599_33860 [Saccharopolyspora erythraea D]PFG95873.1 hypothetical protein A8924_3252 [Saccharopolyspora erythraea NRRL 2338]QRK92451.1 hypothetical protein JQX30_14735 [Saccharopolyspora erythraea]CAM02138.1 hypothetical protein SACE_2860 [Saccharopolyspora erythraea NRRL 2338]
MRTELVHEGTIHSGRVSLWDGRASSLCGKKFGPGTFREPFIFGGVTCGDCKTAKKIGQRP